MVADALPSLVRSWNGADPAQKAGSGAA
jgi:hypothetical protein